jgi:sec-independent protein translocase protein TatA
MIMPHLGPLEVGLILVLVLIVVGVGKLPQVGGALGKGIREFRKAKSFETEDTQVSGEVKEEKEKS